jgi:ATP-dependent RNA helicase DeaD
METFKEIGLKEEILKAVGELGFEMPTPIQAQAIPHLLSSDQDLIGLAQTGTGKTAAFGLPAIHNTDVENNRPQTLILCPTRELCLQITKDLNSYAKYVRGLDIVAVYGGANISTQIKALKKRAQIVVGTPGRVKDLINRKRLILGEVQRVILDEADEMLSMGFKDDLDDILAETPDEKQTLLFSATMSQKISSITRKFMGNPKQIAVARTNIGAENVDHIYYMVQARDKYEVLKRIADMNPDIYGIVFCRTRRETKEIANKFMHDGYNSDALHGDLSQGQRDEVMNRFRTRKLQLLIATDVASRGLDVNDLTHIINFNLPDDGEVYVHRSGRTGRAGKSGTSIAIIHTRERRRIVDIERRFKIVFSKENVPTGKDICQRQLLALIDKIEKVEVDDAQIEPFLPAINQKLDKLSREELIKHFVSAEFNRFLSYYKGARDINVPESKKYRNERGDRNDRRDRRGRNDRDDWRDRRDRGRDDKDRQSFDRDSSRDRRRSGFTRFYINVGSKNELNPARLMGLINEGLRSGDAEIGKIEILKKFSFFEIEQSYESKVIKSLNGEEFEGTSLIVEVSQERPDINRSPKSKSSKQKRREDRGSFKKRKKGRKYGR